MQICKEFPNENRDRRDTWLSSKPIAPDLPNNMGLSVKDLVKAAGWKNGSVFQKFYKFHIMKNFGDTVLSVPRWWEAYSIIHVVWGLYIYLWTIDYLMTMALPWEFAASSQGCII